jgi:hypothetical protein
MLQCTDGTIYEATTLQEAKSIARHLGLTLRTKHKKALTRVASPTRRAKRLTIGIKAGEVKWS